MAPLFLNDYAEWFADFSGWYENLDYGFNNSKLEAMLSLGIARSGNEFTVDDLAKIDSKQHPNITFKDSDVTNFLNPNFKTIEAFYAEIYNNRFNILWGYYTVLDAAQHKILVFATNTSSDDNRKVSERVWDFSYHPVTFHDLLPEYCHSSVIGAIIKENETDFRVIEQNPRLFRTNSWSPTVKSIYSDLFTNTDIQKKLSDRASYNLVLHEEVLFFLYMHLSLKHENWNEIWPYLGLDRFFVGKSKQKYPHLKQLLKFALSVEAKKKEGAKYPLHSYLNLVGGVNYWEKESEINLRHEVDKVVDIVCSGKQNYELQIHEILVGMRKALLEKVEIINSDDKNRLDFICRFNIEASLDMLKNVNGGIIHDIFMFPMVKSWKDPYPLIHSNRLFIPKNLPVEAKTAGDKVRIDKPVIMTTYIKPLYDISGDLDEDADTLLGFNITMEACKNIAKPIIESEYYGRVISEKLRPAAIRAAISQVMARNTSHNIGAHVMNKLIGDLRSLEILHFDNENKYQSTGLKELHQSTVSNLESKPWYNKNQDKDFQTGALRNEILLDQISNFNNYVKCRMDYLADISFGTPLMQTNKYAFGDLFKSLDEVRLLLEYISGLTDFKYKIEFKKNGVLLSVENDLLVAIPNDILGMQAFYNILENIIRNTAKHSNAKPDTTIFTVNFIDEIEIEVNGEREKFVDYCECKENSNCTKPTRTEVQNALNEFIAVEIYDNIPVENTKHTFKTDKDKNWATEKDIYCDDLKKSGVDTSKINNEIDKIDWLVYSQNKKLNEDILDNNKLRSSSLGLVEMDASAAYLRKRPVEYINHPSYDIQYDESWSRDTEKNKEKDQDPIALRGTNCRHFLKAFKKENVIADFTIVENNKSKKEPRTGTALGYRFFLHRPAVVLVVTEHLKDDTTKKDILKKEGIWVVTKEDFEKTLGEGKVYPHEFVVYTDAAVKSLIDKYKTSLPIRVLEVAKNDLENLLKAVETNEKKLLNFWEEFCWKEWDEISLKLQYDNDAPLPKKGNLFSDFSNHANDYPDANSQKIYFYFDALSSLGQRKLPKYNGKSAEGEYGFVNNYKNCILKNDLTSKLKVGESIYSRILVIDERIQENSKKEYMQGISFSTIYKMTGIIIPHEDVNLSATSMDETLVKCIKEEIEKYAVTENQKSNTKDGLNHNFDFLLIHYSILERMFKSDKSEIEKYLKCLGKNNNVVITSGRGEPEGLPSEVRFINLSSVVHALVETHSKYFTNYILHQSKKSSKYKM